MIPPTIPSGTTPRSPAKVAVALIGLALLGAVLVSSTPTLAAWPDTTHHQGTFATKTLPVPSGTCNYIQTSNDRRFVFTWKFPDGSGHNLTNIQFLRSTTLADPTLIELPLAAYSSTGPNASGNYTTTINANTSGGYFTGMYSNSTTFKIGLRSTENGWTSTPLSMNATLNSGNNQGTCTG